MTRIEQEKPEVVEAKISAVVAKMRNRRIVWALAKIKVLRAFVTSNRGGKQRDVFGRTYRGTCRKFGIDAMVNEYLSDNSWGVR